MKRAKMAIVLALTLLLCSTGLNASAVSGMPHVSARTSSGVAIQEDQPNAVALLDTDDKENQNSTDAADTIGIDDTSLFEDKGEGSGSPSKSEPGDIEPVGGVTSRINVTGGVEGIDYTKAEDGTLTVLTSTPLVLDGGGAEIANEQIILGTEGENASDINVTIKDLKITRSSVAPIKILDDYRKNVTLTIEGTNELIAGENCAAIEKNSDSTSGTLNISGDGTVIAKGGKYAAGIGGGYKGAGSNITISGGTVTATGGSEGAGIGGGSYGDGNNITISGGTVTATGGYSGAGIGGGSYGAGSNITISGGTVTATGETSSAGIGGGNYGSGSDITISGGTVTATGGSYSAGIGGGYKGAGGDITISGGTVTASGGSSGAGIGGGDGRDGSDITISGGTVTATGGSFGAGIGGVSIGVGSNITISGGTVTATGGSEGAGIGGGSFGYGSDITISGGTVTAIGGDSAEDIGKGRRASGVDVSIYISDASVKAEVKSALDQKVGNSVYKIAVPNYGETGISYKLTTASEWTELSFPSFHEKDEHYYIWLLEGVYDLKTGTHIWNSVPVHGNAVIVNTKKIIIDDIIGTELNIVSENRYKVDDIEYDCSAANDKYTIEQRSAEPIYAKHIVISDAEDITVKNLNLQLAKDYAALHDKSKTDLILRFEGTNTFISSSEHAGIEKNLETGKMTIMGSGTLTATGGSEGAGIGGGYKGAGGDITISGGTVTATGGSEGAGIGGGYRGAGSNITISGGIVTATGGSYYGAGIGGGNYGSGSDITISGGTLTATGGSSAAGIGGGNYGSGSDITISGGTVTATGGSSAAGIGGGYEGAGSNITISGGTVTATGGSYYEAGIGGSYGTTENIYINGGNIKVSRIGATPVISPTDSTALVLNKVTGYLPGASAPFTSIKGAEYYGLKDVVSHNDGVFYFYLPEGVDLSFYNKCLVKFVTNCDTSVLSQSLNYGDKVTEPDGLIKSGFSFMGWYTSPSSTDAEYKWDFTNDTVEKDMTLYARWSQNEPEGTYYTIKFDTGCETVISDQSIASGGKVTKPKNPVREGYSFIGWFKNADSIEESNKWDFEKDKVSGNMTLYAGWTIRSDDCEPDVPLEPADDESYVYTLLLGEKYNVNIPGIDRGSLVSGNSNIVAVNKKGVVQGKAVGTTDVSCRVSGEAKTVHFTVVCPAISAEKNMVLVNEKLAFTVKGTSMKNVQWSVSSANAEISTDGMLTGKKAGKVKVTATIHKMKYTASIKVESPRFKKWSNTVKVGKAAKIALTGTKQDLRTVYSIKDEGIAALTPDGKVVGLKPGSTTLYADLGGRRFSTEINVQ